MTAVALAFVALLWFVLGYLCARRPPHISFTVNGSKPTKEMVREIAAELRRVSRETFGSNARASDGWDLL